MCEMTTSDFKKPHVNIIMMNLCLVVKSKKKKQIFKRGFHSMRAHESCADAES